MERNIIAAVIIGLAVTTPARICFGLGSGGIGNTAATSAKANAHGYAFAGIANDSSAIFFNPGGLPFVKGFDLQLGAGLLMLDTSHTAPNGQVDGAKDNKPLVPYFYSSYSANESPFAFGIGVNSPFGLITEWKGESFPQYYATKSKLLMYNVNPTLAYKLNSAFSVGFGVDYYNLYDAELNQEIPGPTEGRGKISGDGDGWGYNVGLLWKTTDKHSFGASYRSQVNIGVDGTAELSDVTHPIISGAIQGSSYKTDVHTDVVLPQSILLGYGFRPSEKWTIFADYEWVNWNAVENMDFSYTQNNPVLTQSIPRDWKNSNNVGVGAEWNANERLDLRFGAMAYERVAPSSTLEASVPDSGRWVLTAGPGFKFGQASIDFAYNAIFFKDRTVSNNAGNAFADMDGKYETMINVFNLGFSYRWGGEKI